VYTKKEVVMRPFWMIVISVFLGVIGQLCLKKGMIGYQGNLLGVIPHMLTSPIIILGFLGYFVSSLLWLLILSRVELSYAYPMISLGYIFVVFFSWLFFKEPVSLLRWMGVILICFGVSLVAK
jgi:multidrug transporter EmrE-like cation transporter